MLLRTVERQNSVRLMLLEELAALARGRLSNPPLLKRSSNVPLSATGGSIVNASGAIGGCGLILGLTANEGVTGIPIDSGYGAASVFGAGGPSVITGNGVNAGAPGAGGGGAAASQVMPATNKGGKGGNGIVIVYEYA